MYISLGNAHESLPCGFVLSKKLFCLQTPTSRYFQVSHLMLLLSEIKQNLQDLFSLPFSVHQQLQRARIYFWYYFEPYTLMRSNWILLEAFYFSCFVHFVVHCFVYYLWLFCLFWVFTIGIYTFFCLRTINLDGLDYTSEPKHQKFIKKNAF